jgi:hypothetical protein
MRLKIVEGFVWFIVTNKAKEIFKSGLFELYALYDNGSEGLITTEENLDQALKIGLKIGIEGGFINT